MRPRKWLKTFAKINALDSKYFSERMGVSVSASRSWIIQGLVPRQKYWYGISQCLGLPFDDVKINYLNQLNDEGRLSECIICSTSIIKWTQNIILCNAYLCRKTWDLNRKRKQRALLPKSSKLKYRNLNYLFSTEEYKNEDLEDKIKTREMINEQTKIWLENGNQITILEPGEAEGTDPISLYLISHGLEDLLED